MKAIFTVLFSACSILLFGQGDIELALSVVTAQNKPAPNLPIIATETTTLKKVNTKTTPEGTVTLHLNGGKEWVIAIGEIKKAMNLVAIAGRVATSNKFYVYDPVDYKRKQKQDPKRINDKFKVVSQNVNANTDFDEGTCLMAVNLTDPDGKPLPAIPVSAVNVKDSIIYKSKTDQAGKAYFILPNKNNYEIDVNDFKNFSYFDFGDEYARHTLSLIFAPTVVKEKVVNDTVYQEVSETSKPSSERTLMRLQVSGGKKNGINERVFLRQLPSNKVYTAVTNQNAVVHFLIPNRHVYMIDFLHERNADAINLLYVSDVTNGQMRVSYSPDPRLEYPESFIPTPDRLFLKGINEFIDQQYARPKDKPFNLFIKSLRKINVNSREALFMITLNASDAYGNVRLPLNTALVLDKSGSMFDNGRQEALKMSLLTIGESLAEKDRVSVVLFDDAAWEVQRTAPKHMDFLRNVSDGYSPSGGTNIYDGLKKGAELVQKNFHAGEANKVILLTDGYGMNPPKDITDFVASKFSEGIEFSAIGLGSDYNQSLLELIALQGHGTSSYVNKSSMLPETFSKEIKGSFAYTAKDVRIEIWHHDKLVFSTLYGYPVKETKPGVVSFEVNKLPNGTDKIAFVKFKLDQPTAELESKPLTVKVSYFDLAKNQNVNEQFDVKLSWTNETNTELLLEQQEKKLYAVAILNQSMKVMAEAFEKNDVKAAKEAIKSGKDQVNEIFPDAKPREVKELFEEVNRYLQALVQMEKNKAK